MKQHFQEFLANTVVTNDEIQAATASIENSESQDVHKEVLVSVQAENSTQVQDTFTYPFPLESQQRVTLEESAEEILRGVKKAVEIEYLTPPTEELPSETSMYIYIFYITLHIYIFIVSM
jgi:hypothetical protein